MLGRLVAVFEVFLAYIVMSSLDSLILFNITGSSPA
jgi:hypothetical protein